MQESVSKLQMGGEGWEQFKDKSVLERRGGFGRMKCGAWVSRNEAQTICEKI